MPDELKLTAADVAERYKSRYVTVAKSLDEYETRKALFLLMTGQDCLAMVREVLEPLPEHDLTARKAARAKVVKEIEDLLPSVEGIGAPQVNRWIRWGGISEVIGGECAPLKQAHWMVLEKFFDQHEPTGAFRAKDPWVANLEEVKACVQITIETKAPAADLEAAIDAEATFPKPPEPKEEPCPQEPSASSQNGTKDSTAVAATSSSPKDSKPSQTSSSNSTESSTAGRPSKPAAPPSKPSSTSSPSPSASSQKSPEPERSSRNASATQNSSASQPPSSKQLADQAFQLLQQPEILAGVFRRTWDAAMAKQIVDNLIKADGEDNANLLAIANIYVRIAPFVKLHFEEEDNGSGGVRLRKRELATA